MIHEIMRGQIMDPYQWIYIGYFFFFGLAHTLGGMGYPIERLLGKSFILIDDKTITMKHHILRKKESVLWSSIQHIDIKLNRFDFYSSDKQPFTIPFSNLQYSWIKDIKSITTKIAKEKGIEVNS